jgi:hypothetical protein
MFKGAVGVYLRWTLPFDVSEAQTKQLKLLKPDGTQVTKTLAFSTKEGDAGDGTDGRVEYLSESGVLNLAGTYKWQLYIAISPFADHSEQGSFLVEDTLF